MANIVRHQEKALGELLLQNGKIDKSQLEHALTEHQRAAEPLGKTLIRLGYVREEDILFVLKGLLVVMFGLSKEAFAFEALYVREIIRYQPLHQLPRMPDYIEGVLRHRESVLPVINLTLFLTSQRLMTNEGTRIIIVENATQLYGLRVDSVSAVVQLPMDRIDTNPSAIRGLNPKYLYGVGKYDGKLITVLNLGNLLTDINVQGFEQEQLGVQNA
jgi:purine-binding chemotaxis protein CheW